MQKITTLLVALGANMRGRWGKPDATLERAVREIELRSGLRMVARSSLYLTAPVGGRGQAPYVNAVIALRGGIGPVALLRMCKQLERDAGRRANGRFGARPLDVDVIDLAGRRLGRPSRRRAAGQLITPHPEIASRAFVLVPLAEIDRTWRHPGTGVGVRALIARLGNERRGILGKRPWPSA